MHDDETHDAVSLCAIVLRPTMADHRTPLVITTLHYAGRVLLFSNLHPSVRVASIVVELPRIVTRIRPPSAQDHVLSHNTKLSTIAPTLHVIKHRLAQDIRIPTPHYVHFRHPHLRHLHPVDPMLQ